MAWSLPFQSLMLRLLYSTTLSSSSLACNFSSFWWTAKVLHITGVISVTIILNFFIQSRTFFLEGWPNHSTLLVHDKNHSIRLRWEERFVGSQSLLPHLLFVKLTTIDGCLTPSSKRFNKAGNPSSHCTGDMFEHMRTMIAKPQDWSGTHVFALHPALFTKKYKSGRVLSLGVWWFGFPQCCQSGSSQNWSKEWWIWCYLSCRR